MFNIKHIKILSVAMALTLLSSGAYSDINPVSENYVVLEFDTRFNLKDSDNAYQFKKSDVFQVPSGKKLIVNSITCGTLTNAQDTSLYLNDHVKVRNRVLGFATKTQQNKSGVSNLGQVELIDGYGGVPSVTSGMHSQPTAVLTELAYLEMQTEIYNADEVTIKDNANPYKLGFSYQCTLQGNLYNM